MVGIITIYSTCLVGLIPGPNVCKHFAHIGSGNKTTA